MLLVRQGGRATIRATVKTPLQSQLQDLRNSLLALHKVLVDTERVSYLCYFFTR